MADRVEVDIRRTHALCEQARGQAEQRGILERRWYQNHEELRGILAEPDLVRVTEEVFQVWAEGMSNANLVSSMAGTTTGQVATVIGRAGGETQAV